MCSYLLALVIFLKTENISISCKTIKLITEKDFKEFLNTLRVKSTLFLIARQTI